MDPNPLVEQQGKNNCVLIASWNIGGGLRNLAKNWGGGGLLNKLAEIGYPSIVCFQETKLSTRRDLSEELALIDHYYSYFTFCQLRPGWNGAYSGVATYVNKDIVCLAAEGSLACCLVNGSTASSSALPTSSNIEARCNFACDAFLPRWEAALSHARAEAAAQEGKEVLVELLSQDPRALLKQIDAEGRAILTDHDDFVLINVYAPATRHDDPARLAFKKAFNLALLHRCRALIDSGREVILLGDLNAASQRIDSCEPPATEVEWEQKMTVRWMKQLLQPVSADTARTGKHNRPLFMDTFRVMHPTRHKAYTCWSNVTGARHTNYGARIDYILATPNLCRPQDKAESPALLHADILPDVHGSDHCPCTATFTGLSRIFYSAALGRRPALPLLCTANFPEFTKKQLSVKGFFLQQPSKSTGKIPPNAPSTPYSDESASLPGAASETCKVIEVGTVPRARSVSSIQTENRKRGTMPKPEGDKKKQQKLLGFLNKASDGQTKLVPPQDTSIADVVAVDPVPHTPPPNLGEATQTQIQTAAARAPSSMQTREKHWVIVEADRDAKGLTGQSKLSSKTSWAEIFRPPEIIRCSGHNDPCVCYPVKDVKSKNYGRSFYCCARPSGAATDPEARCKYFIWQDQVKAATKKNKGWKKAR